MLKVNIFISCLSGILFFLSFPKFGHWTFSWICFVPLILVNYYIYFSEFKDKLKKIILYSFISGFLGYLGIFYWIVPTFRVAGESVIFGVLATIMLSVYCSLYFVVFFYFVFYSKKFKTFIHLISCASFWVLLEYLRSYLLSGFPWMLLGYSQYNNLNIIQISEYLGVYGISFFIIFFNLYLSNIFYNFFYEKKFKKLFLNILILAVIFLSLNFYGKYRINKINRRINESEKNLTVVILQGNIDQYKKWDKEYVDYIMDTYTSIVLDSYRNIPSNIKNPNLYIWPESSVPGWVLEEKHLYDWVISLVNMTNKDKSPSFHLVGSVRMGRKKTEYYNSALLFECKDKEVLVKQIYDKIHLVPFGEYVPFRNFLSKFIKTINELGEFTKGKEHKIFVLNNKLKFSTLICYESIFPELTKEFVSKGAEFLINITNDAWFLKTSAPYQHFIFNIFRAVENRCYLFRAANTGISCVILPTGYVYKKTNLFETTYILDTFKIYYEKTFYTKYGEFLWLFYLLMFFLSNILYIKNIK